MTDLNYRLLYMLTGAWRRRYVILLPVLLMPVLGLIISGFSDKHYQAHTSMLIQETAKMNPFLEDLAVSSMLKERLDSLQTLLHSRHILSSVAAEMKLYPENASPLQQDRVIDKLSGNLSMAMSGKDLIRIDYRASNPEGMKEILESVSKHFVEQLLAPERSSMTDSVIFLSNHLEQRRLALDKSEAALARFKDLNAKNLPELQASSITRLAKLREREAELVAEKAGVEKSLGGLHQQLSKTNPVIGRLEEQIIRYRGDLTLLKARYTDNHSKVQAKQRQLRHLESERRLLLSQTPKLMNPEQLWDIASVAVPGDDSNSRPLLLTQLENLQRGRSRLEHLKEELSVLESTIDSLEQTSERFGHYEQERLKLARDLRVKRTLYEDLLSRHEMANITGALSIFEQSKRIKVIDRPYTPTAAVNLPAIVFALAGIFGGLLTGIATAVLLELTGTGVYRREMLEHISGVPVLSRIPPLRTDDTSIKGENPFNIKYLTGEIS
ncbi:chain-length determining protein [Thalassomonas viridans]|uniref:Chain-length determining protein n=1 Tax=Thalassomonas viridans TaxID=137584 RepID=A0AAF0C760_9GAMM|nr:chain-length determining protein [Thalassomonas viridans]WDE03001.1 chain-length determining protein [Thalassomonas viridans]